MHRSNRRRLLKLIGVGSGLSAFGSTTVAGSPSNDVTSDLPRKTDVFLSNLSDRDQEFNVTIYANGEQEHRESPTICSRDRKRSEEVIRRDPHTIYEMVLTVAGQTETVRSRLVGARKNYGFTGKYRGDHLLAMETHVDSPKRGP